MKIDEMKGDNQEAFGEFEDDFEEEVQPIPKNGCDEIPQEAIEHEIENPSKD